MYPRTQAHDRPEVKRDVKAPATQRSALDTLEGR